MNVERGTRRIIQHRHIEPGRGAGVSHPDAGTAGCCADSDAVSRGQAIAAGKEAGGEVEHFVEIASFGQAVVRENGAVSSGGARQGRGMRSHRARPGLGLADLADDNRLPRLERLFGNAFEFLRRLHRFDKQQEHIGLTVIEHVVDEVGGLEHGFVAGGHDITKLKIARAGAIEKRKSQAAALRDDRYLAAAKRPRWRERSGAFVRGRAEVRAQRSRDVGKAFRVRPAHRHVVAPRRGGNLVLHASAGLAFLGKAGAENSSRANTSAAAAVEFRRHVLRGDDQQREIGRLRQHLDRRIGFQALHFGGASAHRIDLAGERMAEHNLENPPAQAVRI